MTDVKATIEKVSGYKAAGVACGLKKKEGALDFALIISDAPATAAGVFTTNLVKAAPVLVDQEKLAKTGGVVRAVAINSGCANACTGQQGLDAAYETAHYVAAKIGCPEDEVLVMSTGVIGTQLDMSKIKHGVDLAVDALDERGWDAAARAIMTTDTRPKMASVDVDSANGGRYTIAGIAKGAGMIAPNMATLLGLIVTDAIFDKLHLPAATDASFNRIVVDGDMSTNDTLLFLSNGAAGINPFHVQAEQDSATAIPHLHDVAIKLAKDIVRDGEGVTKFINLVIWGTPEPRKVGSTIATSPLVKTAFYGNDANWGRIVAAAGRAGVPVAPEKMRLWIAPGEIYDTTAAETLMLFECGKPTNYTEEQAAEIFRQPTVSILLDCGMGDKESGVIWTCDLSHDYVSINADYRS